MPWHPATATPTPTAENLPVTGSALLILTIAVITLGYLFLCWLWPFRACRRCHGTGKRPAWIGPGYRFCPRCDGTGHALRTGRRITNALRDIHHRAPH